MKRFANSSVSLIERGKIFVLARSKVQNRNIARKYKIAAILKVSCGNHISERNGAILTAASVAVVVVSREIAFAVRNCLVSFARRGSRAKSKIVQMTMHVESAKMLNGTIGPVAPNDVKIVGMQSTRRPRTSVVVIRSLRLS